MLNCKRCKASGYLKPSYRYKFGRMCPGCYGTGFKYRWLQWIKYHFWVKHQYSNLIHADFDYADWDTFLFPPKPWTCSACNGVGGDPYGCECEVCDATGLRWNWEWFKNILNLCNKLRLALPKKTEEITEDEIPF